MKISSLQKLCKNRGNSPAQTNLIIDETNKVQIESVNVSRYGDKIEINGAKDSFSMESEIIASAAALVNNSDVQNEQSVKNTTSVVSDYISDVVGLKDSGDIVTSANDEPISAINTEDVVNLNGNSKTGIETVQQRENTNSQNIKTNKKFKKKSKGWKLSFLSKAN